MADVTVDATVLPSLNIAGLRLDPVWVDEDTAYVVYLDPSVDLVYQKTSDGGATWGSPVTIHADIEASVVSVWYDRWTPGNSGTKIHIAYFVKLNIGEGLVSDVLYRSLDTADDQLSARSVILNGGDMSVAAWTISTVDIVKARGGNLYVGFWTNLGGDIGFYRSTDEGATWASRAQLADGSASVDGIILMPGAETDEDDIWCIYWDRTADELSLKVYDNSANSWSETSIATGMVDDSLGSYYQMSAAPRHDDNHVILVAWSALNVATADLRAWDIGGSSDITSLPNVITNLDESSQVSVFINQQSQEIYVVYLEGGTWEDTVDVKYKKSTDGGNNWSAGQSYSEAAADDIRAVWAGISVGPDGGKFQPMFFNDDLDDLFINTVNDVTIPALSKVLAESAAYAGATVAKGIT